MSNHLTTQMATHAGGPGGKDSLRFECSAILIFAVTAICKDSAIRPGNNGYKTAIRDLPPPLDFGHARTRERRRCILKTQQIFTPPLGEGSLCSISVLSLLLPFWERPTRAAAPWVMSNQMATHAAGAAAPYWLNFYFSV